MEKKRENIYDFLRVFSILCIISIHCIAKIIQPQDYGIVWWEKNILDSIARTGLVIFVMISGALILNKPEEKISTFYYKRFKKVVIPFFIYSFLYVWIELYQLSTEILLPKNLLKTFLQILSTPVSYQLWFVYMIIGIYIFAPYIKKLVQNLNEKETKNLFILLFIISIIKYTLPSLGIKIGITNLLITEWITPFVLGYLLTKENIQKHYKIIYTLGIISFIFLLIARRYLDFMQNILELAPTMLMQASAVFIFFIRNKNKICESQKLNKIINFISKYSYDIYLIHVEILHFLLYIYFIILRGKLTTNPLTNTTIMIIMTFVISLILGIIINKIINIIGKLIKKIINILLRKKENGK